VAAKTGNTYIAETMRKAIEIPTANLGLTTIESSTKVSASDCNIGRQQEIGIWPPTPKIFIFYNHDRQRGNSNGKSGMFDRGELNKSVAK